MVCTGAATTDGVGTALAAAAAVADIWVACDVGLFFIGVAVVLVDVDGAAFTSASTGEETPCRRGLLAGAVGALLLAGGGV